MHRHGGSGPAADGVPLPEHQPVRRELPQDGGQAAGVGEAQPANPGNQLRERREWEFPENGKSREFREKSQRNPQEKWPGNGRSGSQNGGGAKGKGREKGGEFWEWWRNSQGFFGENWGIFHRFFRKVIIPKDFLGKVRDFSQIFGKSDGIPTDFWA